MPRTAGRHLFGDAVRARDITRPDGGAEAEATVVGEGEGACLVGEGDELPERRDARRWPISGA